MKKTNFIFTLLLFFCFTTFSFSQACFTLDSWSEQSDNGDGTCTYMVSVIVDSSNGASGDVEFSIAGDVVFTELNCVCNPTMISFSITVSCGSAIDISGFYDAPGNGNDCTGSTGEFSLPVEMVDFKVQRFKSQHLIQWTTLSENNNDKFIIEHSLDANEFIEIGEVQGQINSLERTGYQYIHLNPNAGVNYYRVAQQDLDGSINYSDIISIYVENSGAIKTYPNPFRESINISGESFEKWNLVDLMGNVLQTGNARNINTSKLNPGTYYIQVINGTEVYVMPVLKLD